MIVDDEIINIEVIQSLMKLKDVNYHTALSGKQAIHLLDQRIKRMEISNAKMYKLVLLDFSMPDMDGP